MGFGLTMTWPSIGCASGSTRPICSLCCCSNRKLPIGMVHCHHHHRLTMPVGRIVHGHLLIWRPPEHLALKVDKPTKAGIKKDGFLQVVCRVQWSETVWSYGTFPSRGHPPPILPCSHSSDAALPKPQGQREPLPTRSLLPPTMCFSMPVVELFVLLWNLK